MAVNNMFLGNMLAGRFLLAGAVLALPPVARAGTCPLIAATTDQGEIFVPPFTLHMLPPLPPEPHPTSWDSAVPMSITSSVSTPCTVSAEVGIVTTPITLAGGRYLYVPTYSGSESRLFVVDAASCKIVWRGPIVDAAEITATIHGYHLPGQHDVNIGPDCLPRPSH